MPSKRATTVTKSLALQGHWNPVLGMFQEGHNPKAERGFPRNRRDLTGGAYCRFDRGAAKQLSELLKAAALFAVGGTAALEGRNGCWKRSAG